MTDWSRRSLLAQAVFATASAVTAAGCTETDSSHRGLGFRPFEVPSEGPPYVFRIEIRGSFAADQKGEEWATFHDVALVGYADSGEELCRTQIGIVSETTMDKETVELRCPDYPAVIRYEAAESPCDEGTTIRNAIRDESTEVDSTPQDGGVSYTLRDRNCNTDT